VRRAIALAGALLASCAPRGEALLEERLFAMGTWVDLALVVPDERTGREIAAEIEALLRDLEVDYYPWADGELARVNAAIAGSRTIEVSPAMAAMLRTARELTLATGGSFDPGVGRLVELWGFGPAAAEVPRAPDRGAVDAWLRAGASMEAVSIVGNEVASSSAGVMIDLGGIAKGAAVDRVMNLLAARGVEDALVNAGGDLSVSGNRGGRAWRVGIQAPRGDGLLGTVDLGDGESAFTSGDYERYYEQDGGRRHHILDPATGYPVTHTQAVTVIAANGTLADAAATALFVAGPSRWQAMAETLGVTAALRVDASGRLEMTPAMRDRLQAMEPAPSDIIEPAP
jgi:thiamine biosynthesis lipoprotein